MINILVEGNGSELTFWNNIINYNYSTYKKHIRVISYNGAKKVVSKLNLIYNTTDVFLISFDSVLDNRAITSTLSSLVTIASSRKNVAILDLVCFEDTMLKFKYLVNWLYSTEARKNNHNIIRRMHILSLYKQLDYDWKNSSDICALALKFNYNINTCYREDIASIILNYITQNSNFNTTKSVLGNCFQNTCNYSCKYVSNRRIPMTKKCGLCNNRKNSQNKANILYKYTPIYNEIKHCRKYLLHMGYNEAILL